MTRRRYYENSVKGDIKIDFALLTSLSCVYLADYQLHKSILLLLFICVSIQGVGGLICIYWTNITTPSRLSIVGGLLLD